MQLSNIFIDKQVCQNFNFPLTLDMALRLHYLSKKYYIYNTRQGHYPSTFREYSTSTT